MKKILMVLFVVGLLVSCERRTVLEVARVETTYSPHTYVVTYNDSDGWMMNYTGNAWLYTKEGVDAFILEAHENHSQWVVK